jgi:SAM-dependent methyltransferase
MYKEYRNFAINDEVEDAWNVNLTQAKSMLNILPDWIRGDNRLKVINKYIYKYSKVVDMGCGPGDWVHKMNSSGFSCAGVDFSEKLYYLSKNRYPKYKFYCNDIRDTSIDSNSIDAVISWGVVEHDEKGIESALIEFFRILKNKGTIIITVPYDDSKARIASKYQTSSHGTKFFQYFLNELDIETATIRSNLELIEWGMTGPSTIAKLSPRLYSIFSKNITILRLSTFMFNLISGNKYKHMAYYVIKKT